MQKARRHRQKPAPTACRRTGSGTVSLPSQGCFSPFPHGTGSLSVSREYLALRDGPRGFRQDYSCPALLRIPPGHISIRIRNCHPLWLNFPEHSTLDMSAKTWSYNPCDALPQRRFGLIPGRSPLLGESLLFSFPAGTKMFQFPALASLHWAGMTAEAAGLSHSEIAGSRVICTYPALIAAYRVLHRLREPRHPPCALTLFSHNSEDTIRRPNIGKTEEWQQDGVTLILILCLFCRSMSKNSFRGE